MVFYLDHHFIFLCFSADGNYEVRYKSNVLIYPDGEVLWVPPAIYQVGHQNISYATRVKLFSIFLLLFYLGELGFDSKSAWHLKVCKQRSLLIWSVN